MKITAFGHSSFLIDMKNAAGEQVKVLVDPWLSDHALGDLMGRFPRLRFEQSFYGDSTFDSIFISHSHTDHLDPYSLMDLHRKCGPKTIFLPQSISYLQSIFEQYLPSWTTQILAEGMAHSYRGHELTCFHNPESKATNEDDVMLLVVENETELVINEADAILPFYELEKRQMIQSLWEREQLEVVCFVSTKNELDATMSSAHAQSVEQRQDMVQAAYDRLLDEIHKQFEPFESPQANLWQDPRLVRCLIGQGICFPQSIDADMNHVLFPITVPDRAQLETEIANGYGYGLKVHALAAGNEYSIECGKQNLTHSPTALFKCLDSEGDRSYQPTLESFTNFPLAPLRENDCLHRRSVEQQQQLTLELLNQRFLPWFVGRRQPPLEHCLASIGRPYHIAVRYGDSASDKQVIYALSFEQFRFTPTKAELSPELLDEVYWANDIEDFYEGLCDDFSTFCRQVPGGQQQTFWDCLGMPFLNNDLVNKKVNYHFKNASEGKDPNSWVLSFYTETK